MFTKESNLKFIGTIVIALSIIISSLIRSHTDFYIKDVSNNELPNNLITNTITVQGDGEIFATPDMLILSLSVEETESTTQEAQTQVNKKIKDIKEILEINKIKNSDIQTQNISVYPEYDYSEKERVLIGYRARHSLSITIKDANLENDGVGGKIIDDVSKIGGVRVNNINYDIEDKTPYYTQARELAIKKAKQKAQELADIAEVKLLKPISISENMNTYYQPMPMYKNAYAIDMAVSEENMGGGSDISLGELTIKLNVNVIYGID